jgi:formylglycine-generating enzyme required for sulfatase activity
MEESVGVPGFAGAAIDAAVAAAVAEAIGAMAGSPATLALRISRLPQKGNEEMAEDYFYISYSERDAIYARKLASELRRRGFGVWMGSRIIRDEAWTKEMTDGIRECGAVIVLATLDAQGSEPMQREVAAAQAEGKPIVPMLLYGDGLSYLADVEGPDARAGTPYIDLKPGRMPLQDFYARLQQIIPPIGTPPRPGQRAPAPTLLEPEMIPIPAGEFLMGSDPDRDAISSESEKPQHTLHLPDYSISKTLVTNAQFLAFVKATRHKPPPHWKAGAPPRGQDQHPVVYVSWHDALDYIRWLAEATDKPYRLPSEAEWEKAARGIEGHLYPWGDEWQSARCNSDEAGIDATTPVTSYPQGTSPFGVLDMAGNVWEWTRSLWGKDYHGPDYRYPYDATDGREDESAPDEQMRVIRSGSFHNPSPIVRCAARYWLGPTIYQDNVGFRVVLPR